MSTSALRTIKAQATTAYGLPALQRPLRWPTAQPLDLLDYSLDITAPLADVSDTVASIAVSVAPSGTGELAPEALSLASNVITVWLGGGFPGRGYLVRIVVVSQTGREFEWVVALGIDPLSGVLPVADPASADFGAPLTAAVSGIIGAYGNVLTGGDGTILSPIPPAFRTIQAADIATALGNGTAGQVITSNGTIAPSWQTLTSPSKAYVDAADAANAAAAAAAQATAGAALARTGGTLTGALSLAADPASALQAATKQYVDAHAGGVTSFNTRTGAITLGSSDVEAALSFTPYNATNPSGYQTAAQVSSAISAAAAYSLPAGTSTVLGGVKPDGSSISNTAGAISVTYGTAANTAAQGNDSRITGALQASTAASTYAPLASPALTGTPTAPTATAGTNTTQLATTAFVTAAVAASTAGVATFNGRTGTVTLTSSDVTSALSFTPYNATNPSGYQTAAQVSSAISAAAYSLPAGTSTILGGVKPDGSSISNTAGAISVTYGTAANTAAQGNDSRITGALQASTAASTYAPLASPALTGSPTAPTATAGTNTTQLATTAFVATAAAAAGPAASSTTPAMDGTATVGVGTTYARADHVHPTDTSRAPVTNPAITGTLTATSGITSGSQTQQGSLAISGASSQNRNLIWNSGNTSGVYRRWQFMTVGGQENAGAGATANWAASTAYAAGVAVNNGANAYQVTTAGTSAASGGPTGTGTSISDGSVVWSYLGVANSGANLQLLMWDDPNASNSVVMQYNRSSRLTQVFYGLGIAGGLTTDTLAVSGTATAPTATAGDNSTKIATTAFVTTAVGGGGGSSVPISGGTMTGPLILSGDPTAALGASTKQYVDLVAAALFGTGADGTVTISSGTTTLTRDMHYANLTISGTGSLNPSGYRIFVSGILDISAAPAGAIANPISSGGNASVSTNGGPATSFSGTTMLAGATNTATSGATGLTGVGQAAPNTPTVYVSFLGGYSGNGGAGGAGTGGAGGSGGTFFNPAVTWSKVMSPLPAHRVIAYSSVIGGIAPQVSSTGAAGGGSGAGDGTNAGGGGGGGARGPIGLEIFARIINRGASTAAGAIANKGGVGGAGGTPSAGNTGGGGGGGGGNGGHVVIVAGSLTGATATNAVDVSGGNGGAGGNGKGTGSGGTGGDSGGAGRLDFFVLSPATMSNSTVSTGNSGNAASGLTGGTGAAGVTRQVSI